MKYVIFTVLTLLSCGQVLVAQIKSAPTERPPAIVVDGVENQQISQVLSNKIDGFLKKDPSRPAAKVVTRANALPVDSKLHKLLFEHRTNTIKPIVVNRSNSNVDPKLHARIVEKLTNQKAVVDKN